VFLSLLALPGNRLHDHEDVEPAHIEQNLALSQIDVVGRHRPRDCRIQSLRTEIEVVAQPTHPLATRLQYMVARQAASIRTFALVGDPISLQRYREARAQEQEIARQLRPLAERLNPDLGPSLQRMEGSRNAWHEMADALASGQITRAEYIAALDRQLGLYRAVIDSSESVNAPLERETQRRREEIRHVERRHYRLTILLALAGLVSGFLWAGSAGGSGVSRCATRSGTD
jgi:CHASE3 domain sensor protein